MSTIAVVTSSPPFSRGGHLVIAGALVSALRDAGHRAEVVVTPQNRFGRQGGAYLATWLTDVGVAADGRAVDQVISLRFPSFAVRHDAHVCWLNHTMREYYDRWPDFSARLTPRQRLKERVRRRIVHAADRWLLTRNVRTLFVQSATIRARYAAWPELRAEVLHPPAPPRPYRRERYEPYLFAVSRFSPLKRLDLVIEALARPAARGIRAVIAGDGEAYGGIVRLIRDRGLEDRVTLPGWLGDEGLLAHLARCRAVVFTPLDEDYGFVTVEAFAAARPVITCVDSGGPAEIVRHGESGLVVAPDPDALAGAFQALMDDPGGAERMGAAGAAQAAALTWEATVRRLVVV